MVGFLAYWIALIGRNKTMKTLGRYWSTHIEIRDDQHIVREGPYKYVRHPGYLSLVIENLSLPVMLNAYYFLLVVICIYIPVIFVVAKLEDREMEKKIGNAFSEYKAKTGAFLPKKIGTFIIPFKKKHLPKNS
jgi:protein-S-isoprenylcysteine O-methyltransferase Ste14